MKKRILSILQYLVFLSLGIGLLYLVFRKINLSLVVNELRTINYSWLALAFVVGVLSHLARAIRWNLMIGSLGYKTNTARTFYAVMIGYLANLAIPRIGEVTRCGIINKTEKIPVNSLIGTVISERIFDMIVLLVLTFLVVIFQLKLVGGFMSKYIFHPLYLKFSSNLTSLYVLGGLIILITLVLIFTLGWILVHLKKFKFYNRIIALLSGFLEGINSIRKMPRKGAFLFWTLVIWTSYFLMTYLSFFSLEATSKLNLLDGLTVLSLGSFGIVAPVPGGIGAYHFIVKAVLFELYKLTPASAASFATLVHFSQTVLIIICGTFGYLMFMIYMKRKTL